MHKRGFTFLEILFMVVVISVGLIAIMSWVPVAIQTKVKTEQRTGAILLAQGEMEEVKRRVLSNEFSWTATPCNNEPWTIGNFSGLNRICRQNNNLKNITVTAWHIDSPGDITTFDTRVARR
jgi:Tfp pilus assembly protein PilV